MYAETIVKLRPLVEQYLRKESFVLVDMRFLTRKGSGLVLEMFVDRAQGGITLGECAQLSKQLGVLIEESDAIFDRYCLDVSSPGLDRPLVTLADMNRSLGREVRVFLREAVCGRIEYKGKIQAVEGGTVILATDQEMIQIPLDKVNKTKQVIT